jgi:putative adhesin
MHKTFDTPEPIQLYVELGSGDLVAHAEEVAETSVDVSGKDADDVVVEQRGTEIVVLAKQQHGGFFGGFRELSVRVTMPSHSRLTTKLGSADLRVTGRLGGATLRTGSGDLDLEAVHGDVHVESGSGDLAIEEVTGRLEAKTGSGAVWLQRLHGPGQIATGSGDVSIGSAAESVQVRSGSGDMRVREAEDDVSLHTASGDLVVDAMRRGQLTAKNVSGDIRVGVPGGVPVWTDISSVTGSVRSNLEGAGEPGEDQDYIELRARTVSGDVHLQQL